MEVGNSSMERRIQLLLQGVGAYTWILERRNGLARGTYTGLVKDGRFSGEQPLAEAQWSLNTLISGGRRSAYRMVFGSNPADLLGWEDKAEDLFFAQDASLSGRFVRQTKLRMMAQKAALEEVANRELCRLLAHNKSSNFTDVKIGDTAFL